VKGRRVVADYYPYINDNPIHSIDCEDCTMYVGGGGNIWCNAWKDDKSNTPLFCGPICNKFDLKYDKKKLLEEVLEKNENKKSI